MPRHRRCSHGGGLNSLNATYFIRVWGNTDEEIRVVIPSLYPKIFCMMIGLLARSLPPYKVACLRFTSLQVSQHHSPHGISQDGDHEISYTCSSHFVVARTFCYFFKDYTAYGPHQSTRLMSPCFSKRTDTQAWLMVLCNAGCFDTDISTSSTHVPKTSQIHP